jgi:hypothetical protein
MGCVSENDPDPPTAVGSRSLVTFRATNQHKQRKCSRVQESALLIIESKSGEMCCERVESRNPGCCTAEFHSPNPGPLVD